MPRTGGGKALKQEIVAQGRTRGLNPLADSIRKAVSNTTFDRIDVAVAYATVSGIETLRKALGSFPVTSRWIVGLDDAISQPGALEYIKTLPGSTLKIAALSSTGRRFHPKLYRLWSSQDSSKGVIVIGSGNMTRNGLINNGEAAILLVAESNADVGEHATSWDELWAIGKVATDKDIADYRAKYKEAKKLRKTLVDLGVSPPDPPSPKPGQDLGKNPVWEVHPKSANGVWIDIGSAMGKGREVELPRVLMPYLGIQDGTPSPQSRQFLLSNGKTKSLSFILREDNQMWRISFSKDVPGSDNLREVVGGKLQRSTKAVSFIRKTPAAKIAISFDDVGGQDYQKWQEASENANASGRTRAGPSGRNYGFF